MPTIALNLLISLVGWALLVTPALSETKRAFVVGIDNYSNLPRLKKAVNDARAMNRTLQSIGYKVTIVTDADRAPLFAAWQEFVKSIQTGDKVVFFFAGHGVQFGNWNYLLPRDAPRSPDRFSYISFLELVDSLQQKSPKTTIYILDACRDNPYFDAASPNPSGAAAGLAQITPPIGTFIMYSAGVNEQALDYLESNDNDANSVYTRRLLQLLQRPCIQLVELSKKVQVEVADLAKTVRHRQNPAYFDGILGPAEFACGITSPTPPQPCVGGLLLGQPPTCVKPGDGNAFRDCATCPEMVVVPKGSFTIGSPESETGRTSAEGPQHKVEIPRTFAVGKYEVTVREYEAFISARWGVADGGGCAVWTAYGHRFDKTRSYRNPSFSQTPSHPVVCVSWQAATTYANWLTSTTTHKYQLLSEAEWEYVARAGSTSRYLFGDNEDDLCKYGNGADQTSAFLWGNHLCSDGVGVQTAEVGKYLPNGFGLHDVIGNASEWVQDCFQPSYLGAPVDGSAWMAGSCQARVIRGGSWDSGAKDLRSATRGAYSYNGKDNIGFRVARDLD